MNIFKIIRIKLVILLILIAGLFFFLFGTTQGLKLALRITNNYLPGELRVTALKGALLHHMTFDNFTYQDKAFTVKAEKTALQWHVSSIYPFRIAIENLELNTLKLINETRELLLDAQFKTQGESIKGHLTLGKNEMFISGPTNGPWIINAKLKDPSEIDKSLASLKSTVIINGSVTDMKHATITASLSPGKYILPDGSTPKWIDFKSATLTAKYTPESLSLNGEAKLDENISGNLQLMLPKVRLTTSIEPTQPVKGQVHLFVKNLKYFNTELHKNALGELGLYFKDVDGKMDATINLDGTLENPIPKGQVKLTEGNISFPKQNIHLYPIEITINSDGKVWDGNLSAISNGKEPMTISGKGKLTPNVTGDMNIKGNQVIVMDTNEYHLELTPNLGLKTTDEGYQIEGSILIPKAHISPTSFIHTVRLTHDAVFIDKEEAPNPLNLSSKVSLELGDDVTVNLKGLQGHIGGTLHLTQKPKQALTAQGTLRLKGGYYEAYGQKLDIEQGELLFLGQAIDNPNINLRAVRHFDKDNSEFTGSNELFDFSDENLSNDELQNHTTVGIIVTGKLDSPHVKLYSSPPNLSDADILSMLLIGKPASLASKSHGALLIQAMKGMHLDKGSKGGKMLQDLKAAIGVDFDVKNDSLGSESSDWTKTQVSVGKSITKRIYLRYNVGLFQDNSSVFTLTYLLNKFLSIKVTASDIGSGFDVTYSHSD